MARWRQTLANSLRPDSHFWRKAVAWGVEHGSARFVERSPRYFGLAFAAMLPKKRERVRQNLRLIQGAQPAWRELPQIARVFENYAHCLTEAFILGSRRTTPLRSHPNGVEHYFEARKAKKGVLFATAHAGGWEMAGPVLKRVHEGEVVVAMRRERDPGAQHLHDSLRERVGVTVVHIGDSPFEALPLLHHLRRGNAVAMQIDRVPEGMRSRDVSFLGEPARVPEGLITLASLSGAPILPIFTRRLGFMEYEAIVDAPIFVTRKPSPAQADEAAQRVADAFERFVRDNPTQWFHFEDPQR